MTPRRAGRLGWLLCGVTLAAAVLQFVLRLPHLSELAARYDPFLTFPIITLATLAASVVGALIVTRQPGNPVGWLFCVTNCVAQLGLAAEAYAELSGLRESALPAAGPAAWFQAMTSAGLALSSLVFLLLLFPDGHLASRAWWIVCGV